MQVWGGLLLLYDTIIPVLRTSVRCPWKRGRERPQISTSCSLRPALRRATTWSSCFAGWPLHCPAWRAHRRNRTEKTVSPPSSLLTFHSLPPSSSSPFHSPPGPFLPFLSLWLLKSIHIQLILPQKLHVVQISTQYNYIILTYVYMYIKTSSWYIYIRTYTIVHIVHYVCNWHSYYYTYGSTANFWA